MREASKRVAQPLGEAMALFPGPLWGRRMNAGAYLRLARVQTSGVTATVPLYGYIAAAYAFGPGIEAALADLPKVALLVGAGFFAHLFGFVQNEIADLEVDARALYRRPKPLPSGLVSIRGAIALMVGGAVAYLAFALVLSKAPDNAALWLAVLSVLLADLYNERGKDIVGGDLFLAASITILVMFGASVIAGFEALLSPPVVMVGLLAGFQLFFNNAFEGGFKDHASDLEGGKRTLVLALRARGWKYDSPDGLVYFAQIPVHGLWLAAALVAILGPLGSLDTNVTLVRVLLAFGLVVLMTRSYGRGIAVPERKRMLAYFSAHEVLAILLLLVALVPHLPLLAATLLLVAPLLVFAGANASLYGTASAPDV